MPNSLAKDKNSDRSSILRSLLRDKSSQSIVQIFSRDSKNRLLPFSQKENRFDLTLKELTHRNSHPVKLKEG